MKIVFDSKEEKDKVINDCCPDTVISNGRFNGCYTNVDECDCRTCWENAVKMEVNDCNISKERNDALDFINEVTEYLKEELPYLDITYIDTIARHVWLYRDYFKIVLKIQDEIENERLQPNLLDFTKEIDNMINTVEKLKREVAIYKDKNKELELECRRLKSQIDAIRMVFLGGNE